MPETLELERPARAPASALNLNHNETQILKRLASQGCLAREQVCAIVTCGHRPVKISSVRAIVGTLRRKLAAHGVQLVSINGFGWELRRRDRELIRELLARSAP
jgi:hypothetical protein